MDVAGSRIAVIHRVLRIYNMRFKAVLISLRLYNHISMTWIMSSFHHSGLITVRLWNMFLRDNKSFYKQREVTLWQYHDWKGNSYLMLWII